MVAAAAAAAADLDRGELDVLAAVEHQLARRIVRRHLGVGLERQRRVHQRHVLVQHEVEVDRVDPVGRGAVVCKKGGVAGRRGWLVDTWCCCCCTTHPPPATRARAPRPAHPCGTWWPGRARAPSPPPSQSAAPRQVRQSETGGRSEEIARKQTSLDGPGLQLSWRSSADGIEDKPLIVLRCFAGDAASHRGCLFQGSLWGCLRCPHAACCASVRPRGANPSGAHLRQLQLILRLGGHGACGGEEGPVRPRASWCESRSAEGWCCCVCAPRRTRVPVDLQRACARAKDVGHSMDSPGLRIAAAAREQQRERMQASAGASPAPATHRCAAGASDPLARCAWATVACARPVSSILRKGRAVLERMVMRLRYWREPMAKWDSGGRLFVAAAGAARWPDSTCEARGWQRLPGGSIGRLTASKLAT